MAYSKKISDEQFVKDNIDFMLKPYGIGYDYINNLPKKPKDKNEVDPNVEYQDDWYMRYKFHSIDEHRAWRKYFYEHWKDWKPQRCWRKYDVYRTFEWFNLQWGLATDYEYENSDYQRIADEVYDEVFGSKKSKTKKNKE